MFGNFNPQITRDRIDQQIAQLQQMKEQIAQPIQQPTNLTQNFQLAPTNQGVMKYANTYEEVQREVVYSDTPFFSKDLSIMWLKNVKGDIKPYELKEIVQKDEKDLQIEYLMSEIEKLKKGMNNEQSNSNDNRKDVSTSTSNDNEPTRKQTKNDKSSNV